MWWLATCVSLEKCLFEPLVHLWIVFVACRISLYVLILIPYQICGWQMFSAVYTELKIMTSSLSVFVDCFWCLSSKNPLCFSFALTLTVLLMSDAWVPTPGYSLTLTGCSVTQFNFDTNKTAQTLQAQGLVPWESHFRCQSQVQLVPGASGWLWIRGSCASFLQFSSVAQSCLTLCNPMNSSRPGLPVHHQLPESTQTYAHQVGDAIQPSHPLSSPSPALNPSQHQGLFQWVNSSHEVAKVLEFQLQHQSFQWTPRTDL